ncbi:uncharacterized protein LOC108112824 [Drosophila eugracilis]|uniref:uncharacterized protein LOC108112824 n=1 Tax=Drosophila eugracilis TaxID=29029 RepID=UPI0007E75FA8|nr:uncharacterized protein LOC108112824 [Drosophila eugracilis]
MFSLRRGIASATAEGLRKISPNLGQYAHPLLSWCSHHPRENNVVKNQGASNKCKNYLKLIEDPELPKLIGLYQRVCRNFPKKNVDSVRLKRTELDIPPRKSWEKRYTPEYIADFPNQARLASTKIPDKSPIKTRSNFGHSKKSISPPLNKSPEELEKEKRKKKSKKHSLSPKIFSKTEAKNPVKSKKKSMKSSQPPKKHRHKSMKDLDSADMFLEKLKGKKLRNLKSMKSIKSQSYFTKKSKTHFNNAQQSHFRTGFKRGTFLSYASRDSSRRRKTSSDVLKYPPVKYFSSNQIYTSDISNSSIEEIIPTKEEVVKRASLPLNQTQPVQNIPVEEAKPAKEELDKPTSLPLQNILVEDVKPMENDIANLTLKETPPLSHIEDEDDVPLEEELDTFSFPSNEAQLLQSLSSLFMLPKSNLSYAIPGPIEQYTFAPIDIEKHKFDFLSLHDLKPVVVRSGIAKKLWKQTFEAMKSNARKDNLNSESNSAQPPAATKRLKRKIRKLKACSVKCFKYHSFNFDVYPRKKRRGKTAACQTEVIRNKCVICDFCRPSSQPDEPFMVEMKKRQDREELKRYYLRMVERQKESFTEKISNSKQSFKLSELKNSSSCKLLGHKTRCKSSLEKMRHQLEQCQNMLSLCGRLVEDRLLLSRKEIKIKDCRGGLGVGPRPSLKRTELV